MSVDISPPTEITDTTNVEERTEEYAYLDKCGFTSELFKIEVRGLPKFFGIAEIKKFMKYKLGLKTGKIKRPQVGCNWIYACFQNDEERQKAISALNGCRWKGKVLSAEESAPAPDPLVRKRKQEEAQKDPKKKKSHYEKTQEERLKDATTPLWMEPYDEQLKNKEEFIKKIMTRLDLELWNRCPSRRSVIEENRKKHNGLSFQLHPIERSPQTTGYRNKCEFTVGEDEETKLPTVGFRLGSYIDGDVSVAPVDSLMHVSEGMKKAVLLFQKLVRSLPYAPYTPTDYTGHWKHVTVRESMSTKEIMIIVTFHPQDEVTGDKMKDLKKKLIETFSSVEAKACNVTSLYFDVVGYKRLGEGAEHLMGETHITDTILGKKFRISPEAFFQVNTIGANILYQKAIDMSNVKKTSTVVDICCGTGTIGLCFAPHCSKVLGLEKLSKAVTDAKANAVLNNIKNCDFFSGSAEDILGIVLGRATGDDVVAIVDPPRAGLHTRALMQLRNSRKVNRVIYISCSPLCAFANFINLTRQCSKTLRGAPFIPVQAIPIDMFPHTNHVELIVLFERDNTNDNAGKQAKGDKQSNDGADKQSNGDAGKQSNEGADKQSNEDADKQSNENASKQSNEDASNSDTADGNQEEK